MDERLRNQAVRVNGTALYLVAGQKAARARVQEERLALGGWPREQTAALERRVAELKAQLDTHEAEKVEIKTSVQAKAAALADARELARKLRVLAKRLIPESASEFRTSKAVDSPAAMAQHLQKISPVVARFDERLKPFFNAEPSTLVRRSLDALVGGLTQQKVIHTAVAEEREALVQKKIEVIQALRLLETVAKLSLPPALAAEFALTQGPRRPKPESPANPS